MTMDRRTFLGTMGAAYFALERLHAATIPRVGVQLYTVRTLMEKDFEGTLAEHRRHRLQGSRVRRATSNCTPDQVKATSRSTKLISPSAHIDYASLTVTGGSRRSTPPRPSGTDYLDQSRGWTSRSAISPTAGRRSRRLTIARATSARRQASSSLPQPQLRYAPVDGKLPYDILLDTCDPNLVKMEMDLCWISAAGKDPLTTSAGIPGASRSST